MPIKATNLVIVESPAKARTIQGYLGKDFSVVSSFGHIRDLPKKDLGVDEANNFEPKYEISPDKKKVAAELKRMAKGSEVWLASDEDREGEAIAWHICYVLGIEPKKTKRIVFHEITKPAITAAVAAPRTVDQKLVDAQQARRVLDRLVGYKLSPVLWRKVQPGLSAGRVQSVAVRLIVEREREIRDYQPTATYKIIADFDGKTPFQAEYSKRPDNDSSTMELLEHCQKAKFTVASVTQKPALRNPSAPFTTSTLQQEAARRLGFSVKQTMTLAQRLYESGHITYMRTDSTFMSSLATGQIEDYIIKQYGKQYSNKKLFKTKNQSAQEAHEAIRPTRIATQAAGDDQNQKKLYGLIWRRAVASQMSSAKLSKTEVLIDISDWKNGHFQASGEVMQFDGYMRVYGRNKDDVNLPNLLKGQVLELEVITATQGYSRAPARYGEASLVKKLEEMGIGRPSTYAPTISVIQDRGYVEKSDVEGQPVPVKIITLKNGKISTETEQVLYGSDRSKLLPTHLAEQTTDFLTEYFSSIVDYDFTAKVEDEFDKIAEGTLAWPKMIDKFYKNFEPLIKKSDQISRSDTSKQRLLGIDPKTKEQVFARYGRYGPMLQRGETKGDQKPAFAPMPDGFRIDNVTLEAALPMFALPRTVGKTSEGKPITANIGRYGPYVQVERTFVSIKGFDPFLISEQEAIKLLEEKQKSSQKEVIADFGDLKILKGPYGPYVTDGKKNARIPKSQDPSQLSQKDAQQLLESSTPRKSRRSGRNKV